jgi:hypothetical protein
VNIAFRPRAIAVIELEIYWLSTSELRNAGTIRLSVPPIEGVPQVLLDERQWWLALKFDERWKIVPSPPMETVKNER